MPPASSPFETRAAESPELEAVLSALVDGRLSQPEQEWLEQRLLQSPQVRAEYRDFMRTEFLLAWEIAYGMPPGPADRPAPTAPTRSAHMQSLRRAGLWLLPLVAAALAMLLMTVGPQGTPEPQPAAVLTAERDARWQASGPPRLNTGVPAGPLKLLAGAAQVSFGSGAVIAITAPAEFEILGNNRVFLRAGEITPFVPESASGFTVVSPSGEVIDLGTEFSVAVAADGSTDVFVIDGEVEVNSGHAIRERPVRLTQGFATRFSATDARPSYTQRPLVIDRFDAAEGPLHRLDMDPGKASIVRNGQLWIPIGRGDTPSPLTRVLLVNDFSALAGCRATISFKASLPNWGSAAIHRWLALVLDRGEGEPPRAYEPAAAAAVMVSPQWQASVRCNGEEVATTRGLFSRRDDAVGPYQVVVRFDDSPAAHLEHGSATLTVIVNGLPLVLGHPLALARRPQLTLQTYVADPDGGQGWAVVDDFSVSVEGPPTDNT